MIHALKSRRTIPALVSLSAAAALALGAPVSALAQDPAPAPPCAASVPPALAFDGLPASVPYGYSEFFGLVRTDGPNTAMPATVTMRLQNKARPFAIESPTPRGRLFVQLELGAAPALITATFEEIDPESGASCVRRIQQRVTGFRRMLIPGQCGAGNYRPTMIIVACADANLYLAQIRWLSWNHATAIGRGVARANDCIPFCAAGHFQPYGVGLRASRPRACGDRGLRYTRLRVSFGARAPRGPHRFVLRFDCPKGTST